MGARVTNSQLFDTCYSRTQIAAEKLIELQDGRRERGQEPDGASWKRVRDLLREAYGAAQELKQRNKQQRREGAKEGK